MKINKKLTTAGILIAPFIIGAIGINVEQIKKFAESSEVIPLIVFFPLLLGLFSGAVEGLKKNNRSEEKPNSILSSFIAASIFWSYALGICFWSYNMVGVSVINPVSSFFLAGAGAITISGIVKQVIMKININA